MAKPGMTADQIEELRCLQMSNDATGKPSAIHNFHWADGVGYVAMEAAGYVKKYARPPRGFGKHFFGVKITKAGRDFVSRFGS